MTLIRDLGLLSLATRIKTLGESMLTDGHSIYAGLGVNFQPRWFGVYYILQEHGELPVTEVASRVGLSHPAIIKIVESMEEAGLIDSSRNNRDARKRMIALSDEAKNLLPQLQPIWKALEAEMIELFKKLGINILDVLSQIENELETKPVSQRVHERVRNQQALSIKLQPFAAKYAKAFQSLNEEWLTEYFKIEPQDRDMLSHPQKILDEGGCIFFAIHQQEAIGTFALLSKGDGVFELAKMAVTPSYQNRGIGQKLLQKAILEARKLGAHSLILQTSSKLEAANHLYEKFGFVEDRVSAHPLQYQRPSRYFALKLKAL